MSDLRLDIDTAARLPDWKAKAGLAPYVAAVFLSASLVFLVQPMFAKMATPLLGGAPAVWNVSLVCFQAALLAGYAYAHLLARLSAVKTQVMIHGALLLLAAFALPMSISTLFGTPDPANPAAWLIGTFLVSIAPPFAIISATAPLIQNWYARSGRPDAANPWHLYAASNVGSLFGLAAYPLLMEPTLGLGVQTQTWAIGYGVLSVLLVGCGVLAWRSAAAHAPAAAAVEPRQTPARGLWHQRLTWLMLAAVPSGLLLGVSTHIATDVASAPFLWAPPLMAYMATFIIVFSSKPIIDTQTATRYLPHAAAIAIGMIGLQSLIAFPLLMSVGGHLLALFIVSLCLHSRLADLRPDVSRLTEFYLIMSAGGVVGAALVALLAPVLFLGVWEYPLMLGAALILRPSSETILSSLHKNRVMIGVIALFTLMVMVAVKSGMQFDGLVFRISAALLIAIAILRFSSRIMPLVALTGALFIGWTGNPNPAVEQERGFFGVIKTVEHKDLNLRMMVHGTTLHGAQLTTGEARPAPLTYYHAQAPIGQSFLALQDRAKSIGVVGLGVGSVACYAKPGQTFTYFEIDPVVARVAKDPSRFNFLSNCTPDADIVLGDARITLADQAPGAFDLLLIDAFSSDSVPAHLLTREAMALYLDRLSETGVLVVHISNRHLDLMPVVARIGGAEGGVMISQKFRVDTADDSREMVTASDVVAIARSADALAPLMANGQWQPLTPDNQRPWTDDYSNIIGAMIDYHRKPKDPSE